MDMRKFVKEGAELAVILAEDGAYHSCARTLRELADKVTEHAARVMPEAKPPMSSPRGMQQVVNFEGIGLCFFSHQGMRCPKAGEFYLSGAIVAAYRAPADLSSAYQVVKPTVRAVRVPNPYWPYSAGEPVKV